MKKSVILPLVAVVALGLSACTKHDETTNVTVNETAVVDENASDNAVDAANATLEDAGNATNTADALTNG